MINTSLPLLSWLVFIKSNQDEKYLHPKENLITNYLLETIKFNQEKSSSLSSGKKTNKEMDDYFRFLVK